MAVAHSRVCSFGNSLTAPTPDEEEKKREKEKRDDDRLKSLTDLYRGVEMGGSEIDNEGKGKEKKKRKISAAVWKTMTRGQRKNHMKNRNRRDAS